MPLILGTNSIKDTGFDVDNSVRFDGSSAYMTKSMGTPTNTKKYTMSVWFKRSKLDVQQSIFRSTNGAASNDSHLTFNSNNTLRWQEYGGLASISSLVTNQLFRDVSAWYHVVVVYDSAQSTASSRAKMYVNGTEVTSFGTQTQPSLNADSFFNKSGETLSFGRTPYSGGGNYYSGYVAEVVMCDGQALAPTDFGEFDSDSPNIWKPIDVSGLTFGNNGFYLDFEDSANLGNDANGGTDFTESGLAAIDQSTDTCTNNFATFNPLIKAGYQPAFAEGNLKISQGTSGSANMAAVTIGVTSGKWYCEIKKAGGGTHIHGIHAATQTSGGDFPGRASLGWGINLADGNVSNNDSSSSYGASVADGDILGIALDMDNNKLYFSKNGDWSNGSGAWGSSTFNAAIGAIDISAAAAEDMMFSVSVEGGSSNIHGNFGSPAEAISSGNTDGNGYGNFEYAVPSSYYSLNTKNLAEYG